jgi:predicted RNA binding protein YcfA (HicA-like mRNA interferase family)
MLVRIFFSDLIILLEKFEFKVRIKGSHHIFYKDGIEEIINIPSQGKKAKASEV